MPLSTKRFIFLALISLLLNSEMFAGAWTRKAGSHYLKIGGNYMLAEDEFNHKGEKLRILEERLIFEDTYFRDISIEIYYEYGITDRLQFTGKIPFKSYTSKRTVSTVYETTDERVTTSGFADLYLSGKYSLLNDVTALSVGGGIYIPAGYDTKPDNDGPRLGSGDINLEGRLQGGFSFWPILIYINSEVAYIHRTGDLHDQVFLSFESGYTLGDFFFKVYLESIFSTVPPPDIYGQAVTTPLPGGGGVLPEVIVGDQEVTTIIPSISYKIREGLAIQAEIGQILAGKNTLSGNRFSLGLIFDY